jgi:Holliday junction DNA helicase RuvA
MIARLEGVLIERAPTRIIVDVGGVGYELLIPISTFEKLPDEGKTVALQVYTQVAETTLQLFGFATRGERETFELLLKANRVGPKLAQTILSGLTAERLVDALREGDVRALKGIPGVGPKLAERMIVELRDGATQLAASFDRSASRGPTQIANPAEDAREQALSALVNLGYPRAHAEQALKSAGVELGEEAALEELLRVALRGLGR